MGIRAALDALVDIEETLAITSPVAQSIAQVYKYTPRQDAALVAPCVLNIIESSEEMRTVTGLGRMTYRLRIQLFVAEPGLDQAQDIALAYHEALWDLLRARTAAAQTLAGVAVLQRNLASGPMPIRLTWNERAYIGIEQTLDLIIDGSE